MGCDGKEKRDMDKVDRVRISQCMIVKNEEDNIERALSWGKGIVSEQIVVDTGSTDQTVEIARAMGADVYEFQWIDDFSAAKNFAISKARGEWIALLDADEYLLPEDSKKLLEFVRKYQDTEIECLLTALVNLDDAGQIASMGSHVRFFKNLPTIRYHGKIHEDLFSSEGRFLETADLGKEISIFHTGYTTFQNQKKKGRNIRIIQAGLDENPDDSRMWGYLGREYLRNGDLEQAEQAFWKAAALLWDGNDEVYGIPSSGVFWHLLDILARRPETEESRFLEIYKKAAERWPKEPDYDYTAGQYYAVHHDWELAELHLKKALILLEQYGTVYGGSEVTANLKKAYELLSVCCYNNGNMAGCVQFTMVSLKEDPYLMSTAMMLLKAFARDEEIRSKGIEGARQVAAFLGGHLYNFNSLKDRIFVLRAAMAAGYEELVLAVRELFTPQELQSVDQALTGTSTS